MRKERKGFTQRTRRITENTETMKASFKVIDHGTEEWKKAVQLRETILRLPLGSIFTEDELKEERNHIHVVGYLKDELVATAVLVPEKGKVKMQRVVVKEGLRNHNIGSEIMDYCESLARDDGYLQIYCHARNTAVKFYLNNGYQTKGDYFDEDGIPHLKMLKEL